MSNPKYESLKQFEADIDQITNREIAGMRSDINRLESKGQAYTVPGFKTSANGHDTVRGRTRPDRGSAGLKKAAALAALTATVLLGANKMSQTSDESANRHFDKVEQTALSEVQHAWNSVAVLHEGVTYRTAPKTVNTEPEEGPNTVAGKISEGNLIRINNPLVYVEELPSGDTNTWFGFTLGDETTAETPNIYWANFSELNNQEDNGQPLVSVYDYENVAQARQEHPDQQFDPRYDVSINLGEPVEGSIGSKDSPIADGHLISAAEFERDIQQEGLVYAYK